MDEYTVGKGGVPERKTAERKHIDLSDPFSRGAPKLRVSSKLRQACDYIVETHEEKLLEIIQSEPVPADASRMREQLCPSICKAAKKNKKKKSKKKSKTEL